MSSRMEPWMYPVVADGWVSVSPVGCVHPDLAREIGHALIRAADDAQSQLLAHQDATEYAWVVAYETAIMSRWRTESGAWVAHDRAVIQGMDPDKLAVVHLGDK